MIQPCSVRQYGSFPGPDIVIDLRRDLPADRTNCREKNELGVELLMSVL